MDELLSLVVEDDNFVWIPDSQEIWCSSDRLKKQAVDDEKVGMLFVKSPTTGKFRQFLPTVDEYANDNFNPGSLWISTNTMSKFGNNGVKTIHLRVVTRNLFDAAQIKCNKWFVVCDGDSINNG